MPAAPADFSRRTGSLRGQRTSRKARREVRARRSWEVGTAGAQHGLRLSREKRVAQVVMAETARRRHTMGGSPRNAWTWTGREARLNCRGRPVNTWNCSRLHRPRQASTQSRSASQRARRHRWSGDIPVAPLRKRPCGPRETCNAQPHPVRETRRDAAPTEATFPSPWVETRFARPGGLHRV